MRRGAAGMLTASLLLFAGMQTAAAQDRPLFDFASPTASKEWRTVNDGVMGGESDGHVKITEAKTLEFTGKLSLANKGGFASVRSEAKPLRFQPGETLIAKLRGDGRDYFCNLHVPTFRLAFSYRALFSTKAGEWIEVRIPWEKFQATSFGQPAPEVGPLDPTAVDSVGFLLSDKQAGPFKLEVEWIKVGKALLKQ